MDIIFHDKIQVNVLLDCAYNRDTTNEKIENLIEQKWAEKTGANPRLYAQSKFRFDSMQQLPGFFEILFFKNFLF